MTKTFDPNPRSANSKIAFTGTNSSGKTTMAMEVCSRLKRDHHVLAELVSSQDRKITWKDDHFPVDPRAHFGMITNMIHAEVQAELKGDAHVVITDRSVLDLYAIALTDHPDSQMIKDLGVAVNAWAKTYTKIIYLSPLPYQEDGKRPPDEFRMKTHATLLKLIASGDYPNVEDTLERSGVFRHVLETLHIASKPDVFHETAKWQLLADMFDVSLIVKARNSSTSDQDVWFMLPKGITRQVTLAESTRIFEGAKLIFGDQIKIDLMFCPAIESSAISCVHRMFHPKPSVPVHFFGTRANLGLDKTCLEDKSLS